MHHTEEFQAWRVCRHIGITIKFILLLSRPHIAIYRSTYSQRDRVFEDSTVDGLARRGKKIYPILVTLDAISFQEICPDTESHCGIELESSRVSQFPSQGSRAVFSHKRAEKLLRQS